MNHPSYENIRLLYNDTQVVFLNYRCLWLVRIHLGKICVNTDAWGTEYLLGLFKNIRIQSRNQCPWKKMIRPFWLLTVNCCPSLIALVQSIWSCHLIGNVK